MAEEKTASKSEEKPKESEKRVKTQNKRLFWILGGCCGCLIILIILGVLSSGVFYSRYRAGADIPVSYSPTATAYFSPTPSNNNTTYPEDQTCTQVETPTAALMDLSTSDPGLKKNVELHYYNIYGSTREQLRQQMNDCGPKDDKGSWWGYAAYNINWQYDYNRSGNSCGIKNVTVGVQVDMYYPEWVRPTDFESGLDDAWSAYISAVVNHENTHRDYDIDGASKILDALDNLGTYPSCEETDITANTKAEEILDEIRTLNTGFDDSTNHGANEGTVL